MDTAQKLYDNAFPPDNIRTPRSQAYKLGVLDILLSRSKGVLLKTRYQPGTAECDAWFSGTDEGKLIWRSYSDAENQSKG
jgi:hypothetical protein